MGPTPVPRSQEDVFQDYRTRRAGLIRALTTGKPTSSLTSPHPSRPPSLRVLTGFPSSPSLQMWRSST
jgi:hypothetical protein